MNHIRESVRQRYGSVAQKGSRCCGGEGATSGSCCGDAEQIGIANGYSASELSAVPEGANLGLGCGNPTAIGSLQAGETVLDLVLTRPLPGGHSCSRAASGRDHLRAQLLGGSAQLRPGDVKAGTPQQDRSVAA